MKLQLEYFLRFLGNDKLGVNLARKLNTKHSPLNTKLWQPFFFKIGLAFFKESIPAFFGFVSHVS
jgi:hypothetical protein